MNFKQKITFISSVFLVAACSDDSTTSPSKENTQSQQYQCADGSIVDDLALCAIVDNGVIGEEVTIRYTCQDGSVVTDVNLCNSGATDSIEVSTYTCSNGLIVLDPSQCPQIITCLDGKVVASLEECAQEIEAPSSSSQNEESPTSSTTVTDTPTSSTPTVDIPMSSTPVVDTPASSSQTTPVANPDVSNGNTPSITYTASGANLSNDNGCVTVNGGEVVITCGGDYDFSGSYKGADGQIRVYSPKADSSVYLNLRGLTLENTVDAPIYVQMASKAFIVAKAGTVNSLSDAANRTKIFNYTNGSGESKTDTTGAAIYAKDDLTLKGEGTLTVSGNYNNGIQSSNDIKIKNGTLTVTAKNNGIKGKGSVEISGGEVNVTTTEGDGIKSDECVVTQDTCSSAVEGKGIVKILGGKVTVKAGDDGIYGYSAVIISDSAEVPTIKVTAGTGTPNTSAGSGGMGGPGGNWGWNGNNNNTSTSTSDDQSLKGIKSAILVYVEAGNLDVSSEHDSFHSNKKVHFNGGNITAKGRNGAHADDTLLVTNGTILVTNSYEGFEAGRLVMQGGITEVNATDDGWNAAGGSDGSSMGGGGRFPGGGTSSGNSKLGVTVTGGVHYVKSGSGDTDGIDSNGDLTISSGVVIVENRISGGMGGAFDSDGAASITSKTALGFSTGRSEAGTNYTVSFNTNGYYGNSSIAFKPSISGSYMVSTDGQPAAVSNTGSYSKNATFPGGSIVYYNN